MGERTEHRLAQNLRHLRKQTELSQRDTAGKMCSKQNADISMKQYAGWEQGNQEPSITNIKHLADYFKVTIDELLFKDYDKI